MQHATATRLVTENNVELGSATGIIGTALLRTLGLGGQPPAKYAAN